MSNLLPYAQLMADFSKLEKTALQVKAERDALLDAAIQAMDFIEGYVDVVDDDYGQPAPNKAMKAYSILKDAIEKAERESHV